MSSREENARSKEMLLAAIDDRIKVELHFLPRATPQRKKVIESLIMNRNRVARFLDQPTRNFKKGEQSNEVTPTDDSRLV